MLVETTDGVKMIHHTRPDLLRSRACMGVHVWTMITILLSAVGNNMMIGERM
jgi:hypothetical protein